MRYASICSGVGTCKLASQHLDWDCAFFAEIDPFASAVLAHHYPEVPNLGDFTKIQNEHGPIDVLVGGTPCQSFSVAGKRAGLDSPNGNLAIEFARLAQRLSARWICWENVPGVLSSRSDDNTSDFATFLDVLGQCGYQCAWAVLDAQHFGVPQRRRRVFVVGYLGDWRPPAAVLFDLESVFGNPPTRSSTRQGVATGVRDGVAGSLGAHRTGGWGNDLDNHGAFIPEIAGCLQERDAKGSDSDTKPGHLIPWNIETADPISHAEGRTYKHEGKNNFRLHNVVPVAFKASHFSRGKDGAPSEVTPPLSADADKGDQDTLVLAVRIAQTSANGHGIAEDVAHTLDGAQGQAVFAIQERAICENPDAGPDGIGVQRDLSYTLEARSTPQAIAFAENQRGEIRTSDVMTSLNSGDGKPGAGYPAVMCRGIIERTKGGSLDGETDQTDAGTLLQSLRQQVGEEAFEEWGLGIVAAFQPQTVLRSEVYVSGVQGQAKDGDESRDDALPFKKTRRRGAVRALWDAGCLGCPPPRWKPSQQLARELGTHLSKLPHETASGTRFLRDLWQASEGAGVLRDALSAVQEARRSAGIQDPEAEVVPGVRNSGALEEPMCEALYASQAGQARNLSQGGIGVSQMQVRRLTPL